MIKSKSYDDMLLTGNAIWTAFVRLWIAFVLEFVLLKKTNFNNYAYRIIQSVYGILQKHAFASQSDFYVFAINSTTRWSHN